MGDRAVFGFRDHVNAPTMYLYSHWGGTSQERDLALALAEARPRWHDPDYATRICVSQLIGDDWFRETGYGLSVDRFVSPDYDHHYVVDWSQQGVRTLRLEDDGSWTHTHWQPIDAFIAAHVSKLVTA